MRVIEHGGARIRWPLRARRRLLPSRLHDLASFAPERLPVVSAARLAADRFAAIAARRRSLPQDARPLLERIRAALVGADVASFEAARSAVDPPSGPVATALLAGAFTSVSTWTHAAARAYLERPLPAPVIEDFGGFVTDPALSLALVHATKTSPYGLRVRAFDLVAHLGSDALAPLRFMLFERWSDSSVRAVASALSLIECPSAGRALIPLLASAPLRPTARAWAKRHRDLAIPILREMATAPTDADLDMAQRDELATVVGPLLRQLDPPRREPARWPDDAPPWARTGPVRRPEFVLLERLPRLCTVGAQPLPAIATGRLLMQLGQDAPIQAHGCSPSSLADVADAAHRAWREHSRKTREAWVFEALARWIDDERVPALADVAREAHRSGRAVYAARLLAALADRGSPCAVMHVDHVARTAEHAKLRRAARAALRRAASRRELDPDELGDRTMPSLGLDLAAERTLELGSRRVVMFCDAALRLRLRLDGAVRATFPPARARDEPSKYAEAKSAFALARRDLRLAREHIVERLERMMVTERAVSLEVFLRNFASHPIARLVLERLVLRVGDARARLAEDGTLADLDDDLLSPARGARIGVVHPLGLSARERDRWAERLADYQLVQPFAQLGRPVLVPTEQEIAARRVLRLEGTTHPWRTLAGLRKRGWTGRSDDGVRVTRLERTIDGIARVSVELEPGLHVGSPVGSGPQRVVRASVEGLSKLSRVLRSEAFLAFEALLEAADGT